MEKSSIIPFYLKLGLLAFLMMMTLSAPVLGRSVSTTAIPEEEMAVIIEKIANENQKTNILSMQPINDNNKILEAVIKKEIAMRNTNNNLQCASYGQSCNIVFGPQCCAGYLACFPPLVGGGGCIQ
ncbi:unnamed protein product [Amaranthus hypochondriacus]